MENPTGYTALDMIGFTDQGAYSSSDNYVKNDLVHYSGNIWRCLIDDTSGIAPAEGVNWTLFIGEPTNLVERIIAPVETDPATSAWAVGRQIIFNDNLYEVITAITAGDSLVTYEDDPTNANIKLADPVETQLLNEKSIRAAADLALQNALSHRNLLDNAWFTVNQRGQSTYTSAEYTVDRWKNTTANGTLSVITEGISFSGARYNAYLQQIIENGFEKLHGKYVTFSILLTDGTLYTASGLVPDTLPSSGTSNIVQVLSDDVFLATSLYLTAGGQLFVQIGVNTGKSVSIRAVKLELGSNSTLAMDTVPNYAEELLKCQRYFYRKKNNSSGTAIIGNGIFLSSSTFLSHMTIPMMRTNPTMSLSGTAYIWDGSHQGSGAFESTEFNSGYNATEKYGDAQVAFVVSGATVGNAGLVQFRDNTSYIDFSADL